MTPRPYLYRATVPGFLPSILNPFSSIICTSPYPPIIHHLCIRRPWRPINSRVFPSGYDALDVPVDPYLPLSVTVIRVSVSSFRVVRFEPLTR